MHRFTEGDLAIHWIREGDDQYAPTVRVLEVDGDQVRVQQIWETSGNPFGYPFWVDRSDLSPTSLQSQRLQGVA